MINTETVTRGPLTSANDAPTGHPTGDFQRAGLALFTERHHHQAHPRTGWFKSSFSPSQSGCVEVRFTGATVQVRDTKDHGTGPILSVDIATWPGFIAEVIDTAATGSNQALRIEHLTAGGARLHSLDGTTTLTYTDEWTAFTAGSADGEFTIPTAA